LALWRRLFHPLVATGLTQSHLVALGGLGSHSKRGQSTALSPCPSLESAGRLEILTGRSVAELRRRFEWTVTEESFAKALRGVVSGR